MTATILLAAAVAASASSSEGQTWSADTRIDVRRVAISIAFSGQMVFVWGPVPQDLEGMVAVAEAPSDVGFRIIEHGRLGPIQLGLRRSRVGGLPALYLVQVHDPRRNRLRVSGPAVDLEALNRRLEAAGVGPVGASALAPRAMVEWTGGSGDDRAVDELLASLWQYQSDRGLFGIDLDGIRVSPDGLYYYRLVLPEAAPEGRYTITTHYLRRSGLVTERSSLLVRKTGAVAQLTRLAGRHAALYGISTVLLAVAIGWLTGTFDRSRSGL